MKKLIALFILFIDFTLYANAPSSITELVQKSQYFQADKLKIESKNTDNFLIYSTKSTKKEPMIVYSEMNFNKFQFSELEKVLLFCHELGHFKAGAPFKLRGRSQKLSWSSAEGQADYFSSAVCLKDFSINELAHKEVTDSEISKQIYMLCNDFKCIKVMNSIYNIIDAYKSFTNSYETLSFTPHRQIAPMSTILDYPSHQCRLLTLRNGYLCEELDPVENDCFEKEYSRPDCWFVK